MQVETGHAHRRRDPVAKSRLASLRDDEVGTGREVAADDSGRRLLTEAIFEKIEVLGVQSATIHPTPEADTHGWSDAFGTLALLLNAGRAFSTDGRGESIELVGARGIGPRPPTF
jgi:hypothetical protein